MEETLDGTVLTTIESPGPQPYGLAWDGTNLWVSDRTDRKIHQVGPDDGRVLFSIAFDGDLTGTAWDGGHVWQADQNSRTISRIDPGTGAIVLALKVEMPNGDVTGLAYDEDGANGGGLWYALSRLGQIRRVKPEDGSFLRAYPTKQDICGVAPAGRHIYFTEPHLGLVHKMHTVAGSLLMSYKVGGRPSGLCHDGEAFWIADQDTREIRRIRF